MKSKIANVLDLEFNTNKEIIEIGITMVDLETRKILKTYSIPIKNLLGPIDPEITKLTGWTDSKLAKQGTNLWIACDRITQKYGGKGRLLIVDSDEESSLFAPHSSPFGKSMINVSTLYCIKFKKFGIETSLENMLKDVGLKFEGTQHRASDDSKNIARLFLELTK